MRRALLAVVLLSLACSGPAAAVPVPPARVAEATPTPSPAATPVPLGPPEYRALWVDGFHDGFKSYAQIDRLLADAHRANVNALFVQVRKRGDCYCLDGLEPKATDIVGPARFDPLQYLVDHAHLANPRLEVHAWVNTFFVGSTSSVYVAHGADWGNRRADGTSGPYLDPGNPDAARYTHDVILQLAERYAVDGIHLDFVRYPEGGDWGYSPAALARYAAETGATERPDPDDPRFEQWRRDRVTDLVRSLHADLSRVRPGARLSAALIPWGAGPADLAGFARTRAYAEVYQDWAGWLQSGAIDLAVAMNYDTEWSPYGARWFDQWLAFEKDQLDGRRVLAGVGAYCNYPEDTLAQLRRALAPSARGNRVAGVALYSYASTSVYGTDDYYDDPDLQATLPRQPYAEGLDKLALLNRAHDFNRLFLDALAAPGSYTDPATKTLFTLNPVFPRPAAIPKPA